MRTETAGSDLAEVGLSRDRRAAALVTALGTRPIVIVGIMGSGKTSTGRHLAQRLGLPFVDADVEIEWAAGMSIPEIFAKHGEAYFRDGERRVMARLLGQGPCVLATGGGAFMNEETRARIAERGISLWLKADFDVLMRRVRRRSTRPLLRTADPAGTMKALMAERDPVYGRADLTVTSRDEPIDLTVEEALEKLAFHLRFSPDPPALPTRKSIMPRAGAPAPLDSDATTKGVETVRVDLAARGYDIRIGTGLLAEAGRHIAAALPGAACAVVTDENVAAAHYPALTASLAAAGIRHVPILVPPGEDSKSWPVFTRVCEAIIEARLERGDAVVALGGGVVGDLAGFAAASVRRGMRLVQIPTSLLAQVDSSVGGKTGINSAHGKNLVGAFHQPALVLADSGVLTSLPLREFRAGYAEVVKYGLIDDAPFFDWLDAHWTEVFAGGAARSHAIASSCAAKAAVVGRDEHETGERALLNLGHTFGHALERLVAYDGARLVHGEGVAIGLACAFRFSEKLGLCPAADTARVVAHLQAVGLPTRLADIPGWAHESDAILAAMRQDKKVERGALTFILVRGIGQAFIAKNIDADAVEAFLRDETRDAVDAPAPLMASAAGH